MLKRNSGITDTKAATNDEIQWRITKSEYKSVWF